MIKFRIINGTDGYEQAKDFRNEIFGVEMGFTEEKDEYDEAAFHIVGREEGIVMSYARLYKIGDYVYTIDKICVRKKDRLQYVADTMIRALEDKAVSEMSAVISVNVSEGAWEFFEHEDYEYVGEEYSENNVRYKKMIRDLTKIRGCRGCKK